MLPVITTVTVGGKTRTVAWAEEKVQLKDYGQARQLTLFEHGKVVLQILTSDYDSCPAEILDWLKSRWREENFLKYASENYGIDKICDYAATIETNTKVTKNPARKTANAAVRPRKTSWPQPSAASPRCSPTRTPLPPPRTRRSPPRPRIGTAKKNVKRPPPPDERPSETARRQIDPTPAPACCAPGDVACRWCSGATSTTPSTGWPPS